MAIFLFLIRYFCVRGNDLFPAAALLVLLADEILLPAIPLKLITPDRVSGKKKNELKHMLKEEGQGSLG